jgi:hypothetical protein
MSTIHRQVERRVIERFRVPGFRSLVKSAGLLKKVMAKLGVLDLSFDEVDEIPVECGGSIFNSVNMVQVVLGNATQVFNSLNESKEFYLFVKNLTGYMVASIVQSKRNDNKNNNNSKIIRNNIDKANFTRKVGNKDIVELELWKYYDPKGPPLTC